MCPEMLGKKWNINHHFKPTQQSFRRVILPNKVERGTFLHLLPDGHGFLPFLAPCHSLKDATYCMSICSVFTCTTAHTVSVMSCLSSTKGWTNVNPGTINLSPEVEDVTTSSNEAAQPQLAAVAQGVPCCNGRTMVPEVLGCSWEDDSATVDVRSDEISWVEIQSMVFLFMWLPHASPIQALQEQIWHDMCTPMCTLQTWVQIVPWCWPSLVHPLKGTGRGSAPVLLIWDGIQVGSQYHLGTQCTQETPE